MKVVKVGGSLMEKAGDVMDALKGHKVLIVPGGGPFADEVREVYRKGELSEEASHKKAIYAMDRYGSFLSEASGIDTTKDPLDQILPRILLPYSYLGQNDPFTPSWDVTSDTIACHVAYMRGEDEFLILTDVDGVMVDGEVISELKVDDLEQMGETCVDRTLPGYLRRYSMKCWIINGKNSNMVTKAIKGDLSGTLIF